MTDASSHRGAGTALRVGLALQCAALAWIATRHVSDVGSFLFSTLRLDDRIATVADRALAVLVGLAGAALLVRPWRLACGVVALAFVALALAERVNAGSPFAWLAPAAHAVRWLAPLALALGWAGARSPRAAELVLRVAIALTFLAHGYEALRAHPRFVDLLLGTCRNLFGERPSEASARTILHGIAAMDAVVALLVLSRRWRLVAAWATLWGLATATSRTTALGLDYVHESVLRALNAAAPFALYLLLRRDDDSG